MNAIDRLKNLDLLEHIKRNLWQAWVSKHQWIFFKAHNKDNDASLCVYKDNSRWYHDYSDHLWSGTIIDFEMSFYKLELKDAIKKLCDMYWIEWDKKEFKKSPKRYILAEKFEDYRINWDTTWFSRWLQTRWVTYDFIQSNKEIITTVAKEFWFCENVWIAWTWKSAIYKDIVISPCIDWDEDKTLIGAKLRIVDWSKFNFNWSDLKSVSVWEPSGYKWDFKFSTWLIYDKISDDYVIIVEWETDYVILKLLWFESVIWNLWWVSANTDKIQSKVKHVKKVISFYDNDSAWIKANRTLVTKIWRPIRRIVYPEIEWKENFDVNDLFKMWYNKEDFQKLLDWSEILDVEKAKEELEKSNNELSEVKEEKVEDKLYKDRFFYNNTKMDYFDVKDFSVKWSFTLARHLFIKPKELEELRLWKVVPTYEWVCYYDWWKKWFYNLLDKSQMTHPSNNPKIHPLLEDLITNLCNNDRANILWLLEAIIYKYTHINDVLVPAVVFHWVWWTWKGLFMKLLSEIFWDNNTQTWLTQWNIEWQFSAYSWQKLIVEFKELSVDNTSKWKKNMQKLKTFIMEDTITIEKKWENVTSVENLAWFIMSSNESKPVQLDSVDSWNRRFTIIKTWNSVWLKKGWEIAEIIKDKKNVEDFLAWLLWKFPEVKDKKNILPLENEDKKDLEFLSESVWNLFFKWFENKYPYINKVTNQERVILLDTYRLEIWEDEYTDDRYRIQYFNRNLSIKYKLASFNTNWKTKRWYVINKKVEWDWFFEEWKFSIPDKE